MLSSNVTFSNLTTKELLDLAEDVMREDREYLADFNAAIDRVQERQEEFRAEHPTWGTRYA